MVSFRIIKSNVMGFTMRASVLFIVTLAVLIAVGLYIKSVPVLRGKSIIDLIISDQWKPSAGKFGFLPFIMGTLWVTAIAIVIAVPLCLLTSVYLSEYASKRVRQIMNPMIDLLSGIPPVVYGVWGVLVVVPIVGEKIASHYMEFSTGYTILTGGIVLSIMIFPLLIGIFSEVFSNVPQELRDASLSLGASHWQTVKKVLVRKSMPGIFAAIVLAISRALGETIAVLMVCGNIPLVPHSIFDAGYPLPAFIANNYGEMMSVPLYESALMLAAFILFIVIFLFNVVSRFIIVKLEERVR